MVRKASMMVFGLLYAMTATISTIHSVDLFSLSMPIWLAIATSIAFETGAAACLMAAIIGLRSNMVLALFVLVSLLQIIANTYSAFHGAHSFIDFSMLFGIMDQDEVMQRRTLAFVNGSLLPIVALGFAKCLADFSVSEEKPKAEQTDGSIDSADEPGGAYVMQDGKLVEIR